MSKNQNMIDFLQRAVGYSLTGDVRAQKLFFLYGTGANGKSTFLKIIQEMLGDYAKQAAPELLVVKFGSSHPTEVADLQGSRFVVAVEVEEGKRFAETLIKQMTGGDKIKARFMHQDFFEFNPTHKLFLAANHKPVISGTDEGIWRRIDEVPFTVTIPEVQQDKELIDKLRKELPGILAWAVRGCLEWQNQGLNEPPEVRAATASYRSEMDIVESFINERCVLSSRAKANVTDLYEAFTDWCANNGEQQRLKSTDFAGRLAKRGFKKDRDGRKGIMWLGLALNNDREAGGFGR
jgi:putative DNA primase/helicase